MSEPASHGAALQGAAFDAPSGATTAETPPSTVAPTCFVVIGAGGLGCPALLGLAAAGTTAEANATATADATATATATADATATTTAEANATATPAAVRVLLVDHDRVETHNLQRQVLYDVGDVGALKVEAAARRLPALHIEPRAQRLDPQTIADLVATLPSGAVVLECTDQPALKFACNDACLRHDVPLVVGAALGWRGQALAVRPGRACYRCVYEAPPPDAEIPRCDEAGVVGAVVGHVGQLMAHLALRLAAGDDDVAGQLWAIDLLRPRFQRFAPRPRADCPAHGPSTPSPDPRPSPAAPDFHPATP